MADILTCTFCENLATKHFVVPYTVAPVCDDHYNKDFIKKSPVFNPFKSAVDGCAFTLSHQLMIASKLKAIKAECECTSTLADMVLQFADHPLEERIITFNEELTKRRGCRCDCSDVLMIVFIRTIVALDISDNLKYDYLQYFFSAEDKVLLPLIPNYPELLRRVTRNMGNQRKIQSIISMTAMRAFRESLPAVEYIISNLRINYKDLLPKGWLQVLLDDCRCAEYMEHLVAIIPELSDVSPEQLLELGPKYAGKQH